jgi:urocanate hydratase
MLMNNLNPPLADGTELAYRCLKRVLTAVPGTGVLHHADAGFENAIDTANERGVRLPIIYG